MNTLLKSVLQLVATALTVYGIETRIVDKGWFSTFTLQQPLPFTVLKHYRYTTGNIDTY